MAFHFELSYPSRTVGHCADRGLTLRCYCKGCQTLSVIPAAEICRAFRTWLVDELQRAGVLGCAQCRMPGSISVYGEYWGHPMQLESWGSDKAGHARKFTDGMSG